MNYTISDYFSIASNDFKKRKTEFLPYLLMMTALNFFEIFPDIFFQNNPAYQYHLAFSRIVFLVLSVVVTTMFIKKYKNFSHSFVYVFMPFFLYSIYYSLIFLVGLFLLIIPGILAMIYLYYLPLVGVFTKEVGLKNHLKESIKFSKKHLKLTIIMAIMTLLMEIFPVTIMTIPDFFLRFLLHAFLSGVMALVFIYFIILGIKIYDNEI